MSCQGNCGTSKYSPEYFRKHNPQNHAGCCNKDPNKCDEPSLAPEGSPTYEWEQKYGRLVTKVTVERSVDGRCRQVVVKTPCPIKPKEKHGPACCCSVRYKVNR